MSHQTRREFSKLALAALPAAGFLSYLPSLRAAAAPAAATPAQKPNSTVNGVNIGINAPYSYRGVTTWQDNLSTTVNLGVSWLEFRTAPVEAFMGAPGAAGGRGGVQIPGATPTQTAAVAALTTATAEMTTAVAAARTALVAASVATPLNQALISERATALAAAEARLAQARADWLARTQASPDRLNAAQLTAVLAANGGPAPAAGRGGGGGGRGAVSDELAQWRSTVSMDKAREFRKIYNDAGVNIEIVKFDGMPGYSDALMDYSFNLARALGARAISLEFAEGSTARIGAFAQKHRMLAGYHNHAALTEAQWEHAFAESPFNGANVDIGHFVAGHNKSPLDFIRKYHDRVTHIHVKDRKTGANGGANMPFGEGDTPIVEILRAIRDNKWPIQATIEFEYGVPQGSDQITELAKCVQYCRNALA